jgi:hypothetical protein
MTENAMGLHMPSLGELIVLLVCPGSLFAIAVAIFFLVRHATRPPTMVNPHGFPVTDGPGRFRIVGVNKESKMDVTWYCEAQSSANAGVKAELEGIIVTRIDRA